LIALGIRARPAAPPLSIEVFEIGDSLRAIAAFESPR
jgi:hypothetical protein